MHIGTNQRIGELVMRYGFQSQLAPLDCTSSRRSTVMRALPWATGVTTGYQRDSSSKRPMSSATLVARALHRPWKLPPLRTLKNAPTAGCGKRKNRFPQLPQVLDNRSFHINQPPFMT